jgi:predicted AlkP superfamily pyrophosphatase or phosphodiesterase
VLGDQHVARLLLTTDPTARVWPRDGTHAPGVETDGMGDTFDRWVVEECLRVLAADDPDLLLVHLNDTDTAGHVVTPHGDLAREWRARTDRELARLIDALRSTPRWASTTVVIVSDHDMLAVDTDEPILLQQALDAAGFATTVVPEGGVAGVWLRRPEQADDIADVVRAMPGVAGAVLPNALAAVASGHVVAHADARHAFAADEHEFRNPGVHGQPAAARTLAVIAGGDERLRTTPAAEQLAEAAWPRVVDWAPTVAYLLGIPPPAAASGRVLHEAVAT